MPVFSAAAKGKRAGPRLQRIEDDHSPIKQTLETFEREDQVEGETVGGAGGDPELTR